MKMMLYYYVYEYKCTLMFKTLCNWAILWDPHFNKYHFGPHKTQHSLSSLFIAGHKGRGSPFTLVLPFPSFPYLILSFSQEALEEEDQEERNKED